MTHTCKIARQYHPYFSIHQLDTYNISSLLLSSAYLVEINTAKGILQRENTVSAVRAAWLIGFRELLENEYCTHISFE